MRYASVLAALMAVTPAIAATPEQAWKASIADQNKAYAKTPHAMLKIQDSVYLGEGQSATLVGRKGDPSSWRWQTSGAAKGPLAISFRGGNLTVLLNGKPADHITKGVVVDKDVDVVGQPTQVGAGINGWRIFVYNQKHKDAANFKSVSYYPFSPAFRVKARFKPDAKLTPTNFRTSRGTDKQFFHAGDASFQLQGKSLTLPFYADSNDPKKITGASAFYTDETTGKGAYGAGRYVDIAEFGKFPPAEVLIDFNLAYNPNCALSPHFTCPLAQDALPVAMTAGERDPHPPAARPH